MKNFQLIKVLALCLALSAGFSTVHAIAGDVDDRKLRAEQLQGTLGTYSGAPRLTNGRIDLPLLVHELVDCHVNTYSFAIHGVETDWDDLQAFLPMAREHGIRVWGSVVPPSESPPRSKAFAEPFKLDYERWAVEFAKLSVRETNLVAWSIDDFSANGKFYTPEYLKKMLDAAHAINPRMAFVPCCYYKGITPEFVKNTVPLLDGFLFPYRHESGGANLTEADLTEPELKKIKGMVGQEFPVVIDVYATAHSRLGKSTPEYVEQVMTAGKSSADGVMVYCHQDPNKYPEKYQIVKRLFTQWSAKDVK